MKTLFALTSWGNAGVPWICECINLHPSIHTWSCMSGSSYSPLGRELAPLEYLDVMARLGWADYQACGDVHGISPRSFAEARAAYGDAFRGAHLIAHPVPRLAGSFAFSKAVGRNWKHRDFLALWGIEASHPAAAKAFPILGESGDYIAAHYMVHVNGIREVANSGDPLFKLEELMTRDEAWDALIRHLSGGAITDYGTTWRRRQGAIVGVAHEPFALDGPLAAWRTLPGYVQETIAALLTDDAREAYAGLGYDLSFVPRR